MVVYLGLRLTHSQFDLRMIPLDLLNFTRRQTHEKRARKEPPSSPEKNDPKPFLHLSLILYVPSEIVV